MAKEKTILVAPIFWGLGHATRCIPIIKMLLDQEFNVIIASDGGALTLLQKEFPELEFYELPSYNITYSKLGFFFKVKMMLQIRKILKVIKKERRFIKNLVRDRELNGIISDGRLGIRSKKIPSVYITHQLFLNTGSTSLFTTRVHQNYIKKFNQCWVPDNPLKVSSLSGDLGHLASPPFPVKYLGPLSRLKKQNLPKDIDILAIISGPDPQRTIFEEIVIKALSDMNKKIVLVQGIVEGEQKWTKKGSIDIVNFMEGEALENAMNRAKLVVSRPGYTTLMDLAALDKKAFFIPTPGQYEQNYLAKRFHHLGIAPYSLQHQFRKNALTRAAVYKGFTTVTNNVHRSDQLFDLFKSK